MALITDILTPSVVTGIVSRIYTPGAALQQFFGMQIGGPAVEQIEGRAFSWDIFDNVRSIARGRAPGTGPAVIPVNPVGRQTGTFPRTYEKMPLQYELLANIRTLGANAGVRDRMGAQYLERQATVVRQRADNFREAELAMLLVNGSFGVQFVDGETWEIVKALGANVGFTVDYQIPAGNKSAAVPGLNPTGAGNIIGTAWSNVAADIPGNLDSINRAFQNLVGGPLGLVITDSTVWRFVLKNTAVQNQAGSVNTPYAEYDMKPLLGPDGNSLGIMVGRIKAIPWLEWLIIDTGLEFNGTYAQFYDGTKATFMVKPNKTWFAMQEGSEPVKENPIAPAVMRYGTFAWVKEWDEPAQVQLHCVQNCIPKLAIPKGVMCATVA